MERADEALLPAVYREVGAALHASPAGLGALSLCRSIVQAACYPLAAYAAAPTSSPLGPSSDRVPEKSRTSIYALDSAIIVCSSDRRPAG